MGEVGGPRHYKGGGIHQGPYKWTCPTCGGEHTHPLEEGCPVCRRNQANAEKAQPTATIAQVQEALLGIADVDHELSPETRQVFTTLPMYTAAARDTLAAALAHWVEFGTPGDGQLSKPIAIRWARLLAGLDTE